MGGDTAGVGGGVGRGGNADCKEAAPLSLGSLLLLPTGVPTAAAAFWAVAMARIFLISSVVSSWDRAMAFLSVS